MMARKRCEDADDGRNARTGMLVMGELSRTRRVDCDVERREREEMKGGVELLM